MEGLAPFFGAPQAQETGRTRRGSSLLGSGVPTSTRMCVSMHGTAPAALRSLTGKRE